MQAQILAPAAMLVLWSIIMLGWMAAVRLPAMANLGVSLDKAAVGARGQDLEGRVPPQVQWKSHNYTHLMEQPTLFYAVVLILAVMGPDIWHVRFAWGYVALRIVHSLWHATVNKLPVRFTLFLLSTICLTVLAIHAARLTLVPALGGTL